MTVSIKTLYHAVAIPHVMYCYADCHYAECRYNECHSDGCRAFFQIDQFLK